MNAKMMNLLAALILVIGSYFIYQKVSVVPDDYEPTPEAEAPAAAAPAAQPGAPAEAAPAQQASTTAAVAAAPAASTNAPATEAAVTMTSVAAPTAPPGSEAPVFPTLASGAMPAAPPTYSSGPATGTTATLATAAFPAATTGGATPAPAFPGGGAGPAAAFPTMGGGPQVPAMNYQNVQPKDFVNLLPPMAQQTYLSARAAAEQAQDLLPLRSWMSLWRNQLRDPSRTLLELDVVKLLTQMRPGGQQKTGERAAREGWLREGKGMIQAIRIRRVSDPALLEAVAKAEQEVDRALANLSKR
ncbi:MAG: hypothetical protein HZA91_08400 [Verrucomicrobia bacterium]|nr:hypothetical protein [Verrucomicrobiota bacterium]